MKQKNAEWALRWVALAACLFAWAELLPALSDGGWLEQVPAAERARTNPLAQDPQAAAAGDAIFHRSCASCHGADATGRRDRPSLRTARVREATDGELEWLLKNGNLRKGMPSFSRLPEEQRWQLIRYLRSLPLAETAGGGAARR